jgi:ubiquinone/menaquinone biosynthesis C-methylase UbiE
MPPETMAFDERVAAHYEAWYETPEGGRADALEKAVLGWLLESVPRASSVLEIGCGTGHFSRWLNRRGSAVAGLDISAPMLAQAKALDGVSLVQGNALRLPFADDTFDVAAFITTLEFLTSPRQALAEAFRVARHGIILGVLNRWSPLGLQRRLAGLLRPTIYDTAHFYGVAELKRLLWCVAGGQARIVWHTTLFPRLCPWAQMPLPWGGFTGMALMPSPWVGTEEAR